MSYLVIARKYRPLVFADVIGQEHVTTTLQNAIEAKRLAHAYIFSGPRGVGKTTSARILAKAINCERGGPTINPCNECQTCLEITSGRSLDVLEIDGASNRGIDEIRSLRDNVRYLPVRGGYKIYIIDEFHMITKDAFNALLKTLEEPPERVVFIFATTEPHKILPTILSRCQRFDFKRVPIDKIIGRIRYIAGQEKLKIDDESLFALAQTSDGGMRDSLTLLDQVISFCGTDIKIDQLRQALGLISSGLYFELMQIIHRKNTSDGFQFAAKIFDSGQDVTEFLHGLLEHVRNLLLAKACGAEALTEVYEVYQKQYAESCKIFEEPDLLRMMNLVSETIQKIRFSLKQRFVFELLLMKLIHMESTIQISELLQKLEGDGNGELPLKKKPNSVAAQPVHVPQASVAVESPVKPSPAIQAYPEPSKEIPQPIQQVDLSTICKLWPTFTQRSIREKRSVGSVLEHCVPVELNSDLLVLGVSGEMVMQFHADLIAKEKELLLRLSAEVFKRPLRFRCDLNKRAEFTADSVSVETQDSIFDHYPTMDSQSMNQEEGAGEDRAEVFKYLRQKEQEQPLKRMIEMFDCELVDVSFRN